MKQNISDICSFPVSLTICVVPLLYIHDNIIPLMHTANKVAVWHYVLGYESYAYCTYTHICIIDTQGASLFMLYGSLLGLKYSHNTFYYNLAQVHIFMVIYIDY